MVLELRDKMLKIDLGGIATEGASVPERGEAMTEDALSALVNLGYKQVTAKMAIDKVVAGSLGDLSLDVLLKEALKRLSG
jgi:Holliday junction DNA helicase RuvA